MIQFVTLILSLHVGILPVEVAVSAPVARVEMHLNGDLVETRSEPPWTFEVDLGRELRPHRLEAVAFDTQGKELERASQWVNYARRHWEASLVLDSPTEGQPRQGRIVWATADRRNPTDVHLTFDDQPLALSSRGQFQLPPYDPAQVHHLKAELFFPGDHSTEAEAVLGGAHGDVLTSALTAVPLALNDGQTLPAPDVLSDWIEVRGEPSEVFSVPDEGRSIVIVRDHHIDYHLRNLTRQKRERLFAKAGRILTSEDQVEFILTFNLGQDPRGVHRPVPITKDYNKLGLWNLFVEDYPKYHAPTKQSLWWSVALSGKRVADLKRPRAVVLLLSKKPKTRPALSLQQAQGYLRSLRVPLLVWAPEQRTFERLDMTPNRGYTGVDGMLQLFEDLDALTHQQAMVWIEGDHLPTEITLSDATPEGIELLR